MIEHPTDEALAAFLDGTLDEADRKAVIAHLDSCPRCFEWVAEVSASLAEEPAQPQAVAEGRSPTPAAEPTIRRFAPPIALAASLALTIGLASLWWPRSTAADRIAAAVGRSARELAPLAGAPSEAGIAGFSGRSRAARGVLAGATEVELSIARRAGSDLAAACVPLEALAGRSLPCAEGRAVAKALAV
ncbi:MAG: zf-HC2 domain-containing protein, partial [Myxococcales bacterium]|nr:zf-HC2 domain-containing protein [Myxococcales bacterium]